MYPSLAGKVVIISGGATGIGRSLVEHFHAQGARVAFVDIDETAGAALAADLTGDAKQPVPRFHACDVTDIPRLQQLVRKIGNELGGIDVLVNNAANDQRHGLDDVTPDSWDAYMAVNLKHYLFAAQTAYPYMQARGGGSIICLGSISWLNNTTGMITYTTAKAATHGLVRTLARLLGPHNIRVNALLPGWTMTEKQRDLWVDDAARAEIAREQCLPQPLQAGDIARMALFLAAEDSAMCTQQSFIVDGGWI